jgi:hypothetical protein
MTVTDPLLHFCEKDPHDAAEYMLYEILRGTPKEQSDWITDEASSDLWDGMADQVIEIRATGDIAVHDNDA